MRKTTINMRLLEEHKSLIYKLAAAEKLSVTEYILRCTLNNRPSTMSSANRPFLSNLCALQDRARCITDPHDREDILKGVDNLWESLK